jgi:hypothetical protein
MSRACFRLEETGRNPGADELREVRSWLMLLALTQGMWQTQPCQAG